MTLRNLGALMIDPVILKGFRDSLPEEESIKEEMEEKAKKVFSSYGFEPIDTPTLEYASVLLGKGGGETDKQVFKFEDNGKREVALRFDLTVPFARFMALHFNELPLPFKRYHIAKAWRGEKPQKGRYREFTQCDFDIVGEDSAESDAEIISMIIDTLNAIGVGSFKVHLSSRPLLNRLLSSLDLSSSSQEILRTIDKIAKIGKEETKRELLEIIGNENKTERILSYVESGKGGDFDDSYRKILSLTGGDSEESERLLEVYSLLRANGLEEFIVLDPSIARGLDYYTGLVYETFLDEMPEIGSICSGGRYNELASLYTKEHLPGVGASIGIDRLLAALLELRKSDYATSRVKLVLFYKKEESEKALTSARKLRRDYFINTDIYLLNDKKQKKAYDYAEKKGILYSLSFEEDGYVLKNLKSRNIFKSEELKEIANAIENN